MNKFLNLNLDFRCNLNKQDIDNMLLTFNAQANAVWLAPEMSLISYAVWKRHSSTYVVILLAECANLHLLACLLHFNINLHYIFHIEFIFFKSLSFFFSPIYEFSNQIVRHTSDSSRQYYSLFVTTISNGLHSNSLAPCRKSIFSA